MKTSRQRRRRCREVQSEQVKERKEGGPLLNKVKNTSAQTLTRDAVQDMDEPKS